MHFVGRDLKGVRLSLSLSLSLSQFAEKPPRREARGAERTKGKT